MRQRAVFSRQRKDIGSRSMEQNAVAAVTAAAFNGGGQGDHGVNGTVTDLNDNVTEQPGCSSWSGLLETVSKPETRSSAFSVDQVLRLLDMVNEDFPNSRGKWIYIDRNIRSVESTVASDVPMEAWKDVDYMNVFCSNYPYGLRNREPEARVSMSPEQIYELVETVTPLLMDMSDTSLRIVDNPFCRPMPPDEIFCMVAAAIPSLGSAETIKRMYYHALTDPNKASRVNSAAVLSGREGCTATDEDWLQLLLCPMCMTFDCPEHGYGSYRKLIEKDQTCSSDCFLSSVDKIFQRPESCVVKMPRKIAGLRQRVGELCSSKQFFRRLLFNQWPCKFAEDGDLPCIMVYMLQNHLKILGDALVSPHDWRAPVPAKLLKGTKNHTWKRLLKVVLRLRSNRKQCEEERYPYKPCFCTGKCEKANCGCAQHGFCEKYCCCAADCILRFPGCRCQTDCANKLCPCYKANRECDVDLCLACSGMKTNGSSSSSLDGLRKQSELSTVEMNKFWSARCNNMQLQKGSNKKLYVSESNVHGLGVFAAEPLKRGDLICEYTGEIVPRREADRRGIVYDYISKSYLFTLNKEYDIDATRFGNEARFINHCSQSKCAAEIKLVNGTHRIGIYAIKDIDCGEELFFDYRYSKEDETKYPDLV